MSFRSWILPAGGLWCICSKACWRRASRADRYVMKQERGERPSLAAFYCTDCTPEDPHPQPLSCCDGRGEHSLPPIRIKHKVKRKRLWHHGIVYHPHTIG